MDLTAEDFRDAKVENIERLAAAVGAKLPREGSRRNPSYARDLTRNVLYAIRQEALRERLRGKQ